MNRRRWFVFLAHWVKTLLLMGLVGVAGGTLAHYSMKAHIFPYIALGMMVTIVGVTSWFITDGGKKK